jgi:hypothetical protein
MVFGQVGELAMVCSFEQLVKGGCVESLYIGLRTRRDHLPPLRRDVIRIRQDLIEVDHGHGRNSSDQYHGFNSSGF